MTKFLPMVVLMKQSFCGRILVAWVENTNKCKIMFSGDIGSHQILTYCQLRGFPFLGVIRRKGVRDEKGQSVTWGGCLEISILEC